MGSASGDGSTRSGRVRQAVRLFKRIAPRLPQRRAAVPANLQHRAEVPGMPGVRYRASQMELLARDSLEAVRFEREDRAAEGFDSSLPKAFFLAISGGGDKGAFAAGLLAGWTATGTRPEFKGVTGVSTGALIAPMAFLGSVHDHIITSIYTGIGARDIFRPRSKLAAVFDDAMADNEPLRQLVSRHIDQAVLDAVAKEHKRGRLLLVSTTDLDACDGVIWNMTKIAASGHPRALQLFRDVLVASAAVPGILPPTLLDVEVDGQQYQEMHVDGGAVAQVFLYPPSFAILERALAEGIQRERGLYVIRNSSDGPDWAQVNRRTMAIAGRAVTSLIQSQGRGDLYRLYAIAQRDGVDFNLASIPERFDAPHSEEFDTGYMRRLFDFAYSMASNGYPWHKVPFDFVPGNRSVRV